MLAEQEEYRLLLQKLKAIFDNSGSAIVIHDKDYWRISSGWKKPWPKYPQNL